MKKIKDMKISLYNQDPIETQRAPRYGRSGIVQGTIEFEEENLATFEKVKFVVRLLLICARMDEFTVAVNRMV